MLTVHRMLVTPRREALPRIAPIWLAVCVVCLAATLPYLSTVHGYFIGDDFGLVHLFSQQAPFHFLTLFTSSWTGTAYGSLYDELRPLVALSYQFDSFWGNTAPSSFHISNIVFHVLNSALVLVIARRFARLSLPGSILAATLFAVLPIHAETISWISGRADLIPALFYLLSFACYAMWRHTHRSWWYWAAVGAFFIDLFSKQYAITLLASIGVYDALVARTRLTRSWATARVYVPFVLLVLGYLGLRYVLFGNFLREGAMPAELLLRNLARVEALNMEVLIVGWPVLEDLPTPLRTAVRLMAAGGLVLALLPAYFELRRPAEERALTWRTLAVYFGPVWWLVNVAPLAVTYVTPRHLYLPAVGVAVTVGIAFNALVRARSRRWRYASIAVGALTLMVCVLRLQSLVGEWNTAASISEKIARDVQLQAYAVQDGSLLVLGAPRNAVLDRPGSGVVNSELAPPPGRPWLWSWALPYAHQPPFTAADISERVAVVQPLSVYCCTGDQWLTQTQATITTWSNQPGRLPVVVLVWDSSSGALFRQSDEDNPALRSHIVSLIGAATYRELDGMLGSTLAEVTHTVGPGARAALGGGSAK
jgi:hypothetical protein